MGFADFRTNEYENDKMKATKILVSAVGGVSTFHELDADTRNRYISSIVKELAKDRDPSRSFPELMLVGKNSKNQAIPLDASDIDLVKEVRDQLLGDPATEVMVKSSIQNARAEALEIRSIIKETNKSLMGERLFQKYLGTKLGLDVFCDSKGSLQDAEEKATRAFAVGKVDTKALSELGVSNSEILSALKVMGEEIDQAATKLQAPARQVSGGGGHEGLLQAPLSQYIS